MKTKSAKAKGRRLQDLVAEVMQRHLNLGTHDVYKAAMSTPGTDIRIVFGPHVLSFECANQEKLNLWAKWKQCQTNAQKDRATPIMIVARNHTAPLAVVDVELLGHLLWMWKEQTERLENDGAKVTS